MPRLERTRACTWCPRLAASRGSSRRTGFPPSLLAGWIATGLFVMGSGLGRLMLVPATGGQPKKFRGIFPVQRSRRLVSRRIPSAGHRPHRHQGRANRAVDWFAISVKDGTVVRTGAAAALRAQKVLAETDVIPPK